MSPLYIVTFSLLLFPLLGLIFGYLTRNRPLLRRVIVYPIFVIATIAIVAGIFGISTTHIALDFVLYSSLYFSISLGLWYIFFKKSRVVAAILMLIVFILGYTFSLVFPLTNEIIPKVVLKIDDNLIYKESTISSNYGAKHVEIFRTYGGFFEKRIYSKAYYDNAPTFVTDTLALEYNVDKKELILSIPKDENKYMYTFHRNFDPEWADTLRLHK